MAKRLKYFNEVQIMRNNMELVKDTNGSVSVTPEEVTVQDRGPLSSPTPSGTIPSISEDILTARLTVRFLAPWKGLST